MGAAESSSSSLAQDASSLRVCGSLATAADPAAQRFAAPDPDEASLTVPYAAAAARRRSSGGSGGSGRSKHRRWDTLSRWVEENLDQQQQQQQQQEHKRNTSDTTENRRRPSRFGDGLVSPPPPSPPVAATAVTAGTAHTSASSSAVFSDEVGLAVGALQSIVGDCDDAKLRDKLKNIVFLLQRHQIEEARASATVREIDLKRQVSTLVELEPALGGEQDKEVARFLTENVFEPGELRHIKQRVRRRSNNGSHDSSTVHDRHMSATPPLARVAEEDASGREAVMGALVSDPVRELLTHTDEWGFDIWAFQEGIAGVCGPLVAMATHLMQSRNLHSVLDVPLSVSHAFWTRIESLYRPNPYHNALHGADVMQTLQVLLREPSVAATLAPLDMFVALVAAGVHDVGHLGTTNAFLIASNHELALRYNDKSVLENFHLAQTFQVLTEPGCDVLQGLGVETRRDVRETIIEMVLATDMAVHLHVLSEFEAAVQELEDEAVEDEKEKERFTVPSDKTLLLKTALHAADVGNPTKPVPLASRWVDALVQEWYKQGDQERALGLPVSAMMDRERPNLPKSQVGFIDFFIFPLFKQVARVFPERGRYCLEMARENRDFYAKKIPPSSPMPPADDD